MAARSSRRAAATTARQRRPQREADATQARRPRKPKPKPGRKPPVQAGPRRQPGNPMPAQHLTKPGNEHDLELAPRFLAPDYHGSGKLEGRVAIITGGDSGIGRAVAVLYAREGADVAIVYLSEHEDARRTQERVEAEGRACLLIPGDVKRSGFCNKAVAPGPVWTPLNPADRPAGEVAEFGARNPMHRPAQPEEISPAFVFLAAPFCSSYITGAILPVMGGPKA